MDVAEVIRGSQLHFWLYILVLLQLWSVSAPELLKGLLLNEEHGAGGCSGAGLHGQDMPSSGPMTSQMCQERWCSKRSWRGHNLHFLSRKM